MKTIVEITIILLLMVIIFLLVSFYPIWTLSAAGIIFFCMFVYHFPDLWENQE